MGKLEHVDSKGRCLVYSIQLQKVSELARRGETKRQQGDFEGAVNDFDSALQLDPNDAAALRGRGDARRMMDDFRGAIEDLDSALKLDARNAFALRSRGDAKRMLDDHVGAVQDLDLALQLEPNNAVALSSRGDSKRMLQDAMGAIADLDVALRLDPRNGFALSCRAASKRVMGDFLGAISDLDRALELDPADAFALRRRGEAKRLARDFAGAIKDLDLSLVIEPANALALWRRGEAKRQQGDCTAAMADLNLALQLEPINPTALCSRSDTKLMMEDHQGAWDDLMSALHFDPDNAHALRSRGELKRLQNDFAGAIEDLDRSLQLEPRNAVALSSRGDAKRMLDDCQGALADLDLALELEPDNALDLARRGEVKREQGDFAGAIDDLDLALELEPRNVVALSSRGDAKRMMQDCVGALEDLDLALQIDPENPFALCCRGEAEKMEESRWFVQKADILGALAQCYMSQQLKWAIIGAGPSSLTLALTMAEAMQARQMDPNMAKIDLYLGTIEKNDTAQWQRKLSPFSFEVMTLQDTVLESMSPALKSAFERSAPVQTVEMKLLAKAQQPPFNNYIRIHEYTETDIQPEWLNALDADVVVTDSGAVRRALPGAFVNPAARHVEHGAQQIPVSLEGSECTLVEADFALGINLTLDRASKQARFNAIFSMAQNVYLLHFDEALETGCLKIRITKEEYHEILEAVGRSPESEGDVPGPLRLFGEDDVHLITDEKPSMLQLRLPWLKRRICEGCKLYGLELEQMTSITGLQLRPAYAQCFYHVLPTSSGPKLLLLAGEAAISDNFSPCRGLNSGLKSVAAIAKMWLQCETLAHGASKYNGFMDKLRRFELQHCLAPRQQLPWGGALLRSMESPEAQNLDQRAREQEEVNRQSFLENCKLWRDFLQQSEGWPHESVTDEDLEEQLQKTVRPKELELHLMVSSASTRPSSAASSTSSRRSGSGSGSSGAGARPWSVASKCHWLEPVDPSSDEHWLK